MGLVKGKKALILGVANERSLAYAIAQRLAGEGAAMVLTYQGEAVESRVRNLASELQAAAVEPCDVTRDGDIDAVVDATAHKLGGLDIVVHAVAFADKEALVGRYCDVSRASFLKALDIGVYSFTALARGAARLMEASGGSMLTLTYFGAEKVVPHYNVMGITKAALEASVRYLAADLGPNAIRVNAISAGPIKTLSAKGVRDFNSMLALAGERSPLRRNITGRDVADAAMFLLSDLGAGVTGEILHVDAGYNIMGM